MKRIIFIITLLLLTVILNANSILSYGVKLGGTLSTQDFDYKSVQIELDTEHRWGFDIGLFTEFKIIDNLTLLTELHYCQKGMKVTLEVIDENNFDPPEKVEFSNRVDYLAIPILVKFKPDKVPAYFVGGIQGDVLIGYESKLLSSVYDELESLDFSFVAGMGFEYNIPGFRTMLLELRYNPSLTASFDNENLTIKNESFSLLTGIRF